MLIGTPVLLVAVVALFGRCEVHAWRHEPRMAAESAVAFAESAILRSDSDAAYELLVPEFREEISTDDIATWVEVMHPVGLPDSIQATEFQSTPGYKGMMIFLVGQSEGEMFYYRMQMQGTAPSGYEVAGFWRGGPGPYPNPEDRSPLPGHRN